MTPIRSILARRGAFSLLTLFLSLSGCTNLSSVTAGSCGNLVVEPSANEDCDGSADCGAPGAIHACRFLCNPADPPETNACAAHPGYQCGADGVCRAPSRKYVATNVVTTAPADDMLVGDINADGCAEVIVSAMRQTNLYAFSSPFSKSCVDSQQTLSVSRPDPEQSSLPLASLEHIDTTDTSKRMSLILPIRSKLQHDSKNSSDGLSVGFSNGAPTLLPNLFPRFLRGKPDIRTVVAQLRKANVVVLFEDDKDLANTTKVFLIVDNLQAPQVLMGTYPAKVADIATVVAMDVDSMVNQADNIKCDELIMAKKGDDKLEVFRLCVDGTRNDFVEMQNSEIKLTNSSPPMPPMPPATPKVRDSDQAIYAVDANGDGYLDVVTNATDQKVHVAYGFPDGRFHSTLPLPTPAMNFDQTADAVMGDMRADDAAQDGKIFVALEYDDKHPGVDYYGVPCPPLTEFSSPNCTGIIAGCEAVVADIDADGDMDIVVSEGQGVDLAIHRQTGGVFNVTFLETTCPPHHLGAGDFDGDGVTDIAFFDQVLKNVTEEKRNNTTALSIVYGNAFAVPDPPVLSGRYDDATGLTAVRFTPPGTESQIAITRTIGTNNEMNMPQGSAIGIVEVSAERTVVAPYYVTADIMGAQTIDQLTLLEQTPGHFGPNGGPGLAVLTTLAGTANSPVELWSIRSEADSGTLLANPRIDTNDVPCANGCVLAALDHPQAQGDLMLLGDGVGAIYTEQNSKFTKTADLALTHSFRNTTQSSNMGMMGGMMGGMMQGPTSYFPRPYVKDVNNDTINDVLVLATSGAFVGFFGNPDGTFTEVELVQAPSAACWDSTTGWVRPGCGNYTAAQLDVDGDGKLDLVIAGSELPNVDKTMPLAAYQVKGHELINIPGITFEVPAFTGDTDFVSLAAADMDSDGVEDLVFMSNSNFFTVLRGKPVVE